MVAERYRASGVLEDALWGLKDMFQLNDQVALQMAECGQANGIWRTQRRRILVCYELPLFIKFVFEITGVPADQIDALVNGVFIAIVWHEVAHMLHFELDLPIVGNSEDAADQLSTLILLAQGQDATAMALANADLYERRESAAFQEAAQKVMESLGISAPTQEGLDEAAKSRMKFMSKHSLGLERAIDIMCLIYGQSPETRGHLVGPKALHSNYAQRCPGEFEALSRNWQRLLEPHARPPNEIALRRCTRMEDHLIQFMQQHGAPAEDITARQQNRAAQLERCVNTTLADPIQANKAMRCIRHAQSPPEAAACAR